jgi:hypothetical protein
MQSTPLSRRFTPRAALRLLACGRKLGGRWGGVGGALGGRWGDVGGTLGGRWGDVGGTLGGRWMQKVARVQRVVQPLPRCKQRRWARKGGGRCAVERMERIANTVAGTYGTERLVVHWWLLGRCVAA